MTYDEAWRRYGSLAMKIVDKYGDRLPYDERVQNARIGIWTVCNWPALQELDGEDRRRAYVGGIIRRTVIDDLRSWGMVKEKRYSLPKVHADAVSLNEKASLRRTTGDLLDVEWLDLIEDRRHNLQEDAELWWAIEHLPENWRKAFLMAEAGVPHKEIASLLGCVTHTVDQWRWKAKTELRRLLR